MFDFIAQPDFRQSDWTNRRPMPFKALRLFKVLRWAGSSDEGPEGWQKDHEYEETTSLDDAHIVSSQLRGEDRHTVVLDIDIPAALVPSTTPGHSHLYIDARMTWDTYSALLDALADAGVIERGYAGASKARKFSAVRLPWVEK